jgi:ABC-type transport system involved in multi-copper enzyme maturation permease subunit
MVGPVLFQELLLGSRRNRLYLLRWCYAGWLLLQLGWMYLGQTMNVWIRWRRPLTYEDIAAFAQDYLTLLVTQHFLLLLLATPTLTAGAVTDEKSRGTLQYLLTTELRPWEVLVGKLLARSWLVLSLALPALPLLCFFGVLGGLDLGRLLALVVVTVGVVFGLAGASLLASALCRHTRDAVLALYALGAALYLAARWLHARLADWTLAAELGETTETAPGVWRGLAALLDCFDPLHPLGPGWAADDAGQRGRRVLAALATWGTLGLVCLAAAAWRLRPAYLRYLQSQGRKKPRWWRAQRAPLTGEPIRWKERHVEGIAPLAVLRDFPRWLGLLLVALAATFASGSIFLSHLGVPASRLWEALRGLDFEGLIELLGSVAPASEEFYWQGFLVMLLAALVLGVRCSGAVTGERERQTWEALLLTPLETRTLIRGKFWGILGAAVPYVLAYAVPTLALAALCGWAAFFWTALWLAVTCLAAAYAGAAGLWCSVRSSTSWRGMMGTLALTYLGGFVIYSAGSSAGCILAMILLLVASLLSPSFGLGLGGMAVGWQFFRVGMCIVLAAGFVLAAWRLLVSAEYRVGVLERTKHWQYAPEGYEPLPSVLPAPRPRSRWQAEGRWRGGDP